MLKSMMPATRWPIALDLGSDSIKMLQIQKTGPLVKVGASGRFKVPAHVTDPGQRRQTMVAAVRDMLRHGHFSGRKVVTSLSCAELNVKNVRLPHMPEAELAQAVQWEAKERFEFEVRADQLAFLNAGTVRSGNETRDEIIMLAVRSEVIDEHLSLLKDMGLSPLHIDAEPVALFRVFERFLRRKVDEQQVTVLVDVGLHATRVVVARGRQIVFVKCIELGGQRFNEAVAKRLNLSYEEAAELRIRQMREHGESGAKAAAVPGEAGHAAVSVEWSLHDAIRGDVEVLAHEIGLCLRYCSVTFRGLRPDRMIVTGGEAYDPSLLPLFSEQLGLECVVGQPLRGIDLSAADLGANRRGMLSEWALCTGLAMRTAEFPVLEEADNGKQDRLSA